MATADEILARLTCQQLRDGLARGAAQLAALDALEAAEDFTPQGPFPLSKGYEEWSGRDYAERRRLLNLAMSDTRREQARRAVLATGAGQ